jgi:dTDP-4-amino-4,6-dideoxygalactose transaminase
MAVRYSYLKDQFADCEDLWSDLREFVATGDFTLGKPLVEFEGKFSQLIGTEFAIGVNSGTDALKIALKALGIKPGDEVITAANTFVATVGAINELGAIPVFVDVDDTFCMNTSLVEAAITPKTRAIVPVHFTGYMTRMDEIMDIASRHDLVVVEDACQGILAEWKGRKSGTWGHAAAFSLHPLKNLNVWSDGGMIVTNDQRVADRIKLLRNHGLISRDNVEILGFNSRLDTFQAVVGNWLIPQAVSISEKRIKNAAKLDLGLSKLRQIEIPPRPSDMRVVYHLYIVFAENRDGLLAHCKKNGIEAKVHYPIPIYKQKALQEFYQNQDFPVTNSHAKKIISFPCDQHLQDSHLEEIIEVVTSFYSEAEK